MTDDAWQKIWGEKLRRRQSKTPDVPLGQKRPESVEGWEAIVGSRLRDKATGANAKAMLWKSTDWMARLRQRKKDIADGKQPRARKVKNLELWRAEGTRLQLDKRGNYITSHPQVVVPKTGAKQAGSVPEALGAQAEGRLEAPSVKRPRKSKGAAKTRRKK